MKSKMKWFLSIGLLLFVQLSFAQEKTLTGVVQEVGLPLPGVSVTIVGTDKGTQTDLNGKYSIIVSEGQTVLFSFIGLKDVTHKVGAGNVFDVEMESDEEMLEEVVVTALGIKRDKRKLGYSSQEVKGDELSSAGQTNAVS